MYMYIIYIFVCVVSGNSSTLSATGLSVVDLSTPPGAYSQVVSIVDSSGIVLLVPAHRLHWRKCTPTLTSGQAPGQRLSDTALCPCALCHQYSGKNEYQWCMYVHVMFIVWIPVHLLCLRQFWCTLSARNLLCVCWLWCFICCRCLCRATGYRQGHAGDLPSKTAQDGATAVTSAVRQCVFVATFVYPSHRRVL